MGNCVADRKTEDECLKPIIIKDSREQITTPKRVRFSDGFETKISNLSSNTSICKSVDTIEQSDLDMQNVAEGASSEDDTEDESENESENESEDDTDDESEDDETDNGDETDRREKIRILVESEWRKRFLRCLLEAEIAKTAEMRARAIEEARPRSDACVSDSDVSDTSDTSDTSDASDTHDKSVKSDTPDASLSIKKPDDKITEEVKRVSGTHKNNGKTLRYGLLALEAVALALGAYTASVYM
jgi:hypothetical protein